MSEGEGRGGLGCLGEDGWVGLGACVRGSMREVWHVVGFRVW